MAKEHFCNDQESMVDRSRRRECVELKLSRQSVSRVKGGGKCGKWRAPISCSLYSTEYVHLG